MLVPSPPCPAEQGQGSYETGQVPFWEGDSGPLLQLVHLPRDLTRDGDTSQLARSPASGEVVMVVCHGTLVLLGTG